MPTPEASEATQEIQAAGLSLLALRELRAMIESDQIEEAMVKLQKATVLRRLAQPRGWAAAPGALLEEIARNGAKQGRFERWMRSREATSALEAARQLLLPHGGGWNLGQRLLWSTDDPNQLREMLNEAGIEIHGSNTGLEANRAAAAIAQQIAHQAGIEPDADGLLPRQDGPILAMLLLGEARGEEAISSSILELLGPNSRKAALDFIVLNCSPAWLMRSSHSIGQALKLGERSQREETKALVGKLLERAKVIQEQQEEREGRNYQHAWPGERARWAARRRRMGSWEQLCRAAWHLRDGNSSNGVWASEWFSIIHESKADQLASPALLGPKVEEDWRRWKRADAGGPALEVQDSRERSAISSDLSQELRSLLMLPLGPPRLEQWLDSGEIDRSTAWEWSTARSGGDQETAEWLMTQAKPGREAQGIAWLSTLRRELKSSNEGRWPITRWLERKLRAQAEGIEELAPEIANACERWAEEASQPGRPEEIVNRLSIRLATAHTLLERQEKQGMLAALAEGTTPSQAAIRSAARQGAALRIRAAASKLAMKLDAIQCLAIQNSSMQRQGNLPLALTFAASDLGVSAQASDQSKLEEAWMEVACRVQEAIEAQKTPREDRDARE